MSTYSIYKARTQGRIRIVWVVLVTIVGLIATWLTFELAPALATAAADTVGTVESVKKLLTIVQLEASIPLLVKIVMVVPLTLLAFRSRERVASYIFERWFDQFDEEVWHPIRRPAPSHHGEVILPWLAPDTTMATPGRAKIWQEMRAWAEEGAAMASGSPPAVPFSWALLVGRSGTGKSRHADEFARMLARRDILGDSDEPVRAWGVRWKRWQFQVATKFRRACRRPLVTDPWDAGRPAHRKAQGSELLPASTTYELNFQAWRPRAPTLIVFEDPRAEEAAALIAWLSAKVARTDAQNPETPYRFPVRMLIVNQTLPFDLMLSPNAIPHSWRSGLPHFRGDPWVMNDHHHLTWDETLELSRRAFRRDDRRAFVLRDLQLRFDELTRCGHPLLVESLFGWIMGHPEGALPNVNDRLTAERLLAERAQRVLVALQAAGIETHEQFCGLAAASIVDGLPRESVAGQRPLIEPAALQRVFPDADVQLRVPAVRPDLIGLAFAELVVTMPLEAGVAGPAAPSVQRKSADRIAELAWKSDAYAVLRTLDRQLHRQAAIGAGTSSEPLKLIVGSLERTAADITDLDPGVALRAFARYYLVHGRGQGNLRSVMQQVPEALVLEELAGPKLLSLAQPHNAAVRDLLAVFSMACERVLVCKPSTIEVGALPQFQITARLVDFYCQLADALGTRGRLPLGDAIVPTEGFRILGRSAVEMWSVHATVGENNEPMWPNVLERLWKSSPTRQAGLEAFADAFRGRERVHTVPAWLGSSYAIALRGDVAETDALESCLQSEMQGAIDYALAVYLAVAWTNATYARCSTGPIYAAEHGERNARRIAEIAGRFDTLALNVKRMFAERQGVAWLRIAYACGRKQTEQGAILAQRCAKRIAALTQPFSALSIAEQVNLAESQIWAWLYAANAHAEAKAPESTVNVERCIDRMSEIAQRFWCLPSSIQRTFAEALSTAWMQCAFAYSQLPTGMGAARAESCAERLADILQPFEDWSLPEKHVFMCLQADAWSHAAHAHCRSERVDGATQAARCAQRIAALAQLCTDLPLAERLQVAYRWATACSHAAYAYASLDAREDLLQVERIAQMIAGIVQPFEALPLSEQVVLAEPLVSAWAEATRAYAGGLLGSGAANAERCTQRIAEVIHRYEGLQLDLKWTLAEHQARALVYLAVAHGKAGTAEGAAHAEQVAQRTADFVEGFRSCALEKQRVLDRYRALSWGSALMAHRGVPGMPTSSQLVERVVEAFAADTGMDVEEREFWMENMGLPQQREGRA